MIPQSAVDGRDFTACETSYGSRGGGWAGGNHRGKKIHPQKKNVLPLGMLYQRESGLCCSKKIHLGAKQSSRRFPNSKHWEIPPPHPHPQIKNKNEPRDVEEMKGGGKGLRMTSGKGVPDPQTKVPG